MNRWIDKMERKFGRYAIHNLTIFLVAIYAAGYFATLCVPKILLYFTLEPGLIMQGQIWRLISWMMVPYGGNIFIELLVMYMFYNLGRTLENVWGAFRYNLYILSGIIFNIAGAFILYAYAGGIVGYGILFSPYYMYMSLFLACAVIMPEMEFLIYFMIPVKIKWLAIFDVVLLVIEAIRGGMAIRIVIVASLLNFILFFLGNRRMQPYTPKQMVRKKKFQKEIKRPVNQYEGGARHKCAVCGRTELDDPNLEFRYCSRCNGNYEYCQDHLFTHEHVK